MTADEHTIRIGHNRVWLECQAVWILDTTLGEDAKPIVLEPAEAERLRRWLAEILSSEPVCRWAPIEEGSRVYEPGCCTERWQLDDDCELYPFCHWCGDRIYVVEAALDWALLAVFQHYTAGEASATPGAFEEIEKGRARFIIECNRLIAERYSESGKVAIPVHADPSGKTREPPHCPTCDCASFPQGHHDSDWPQAPRCPKCGESTDMPVGSYHRCAQKATVVPSVCGKPMPDGKGAGQCINVPGHEGECDDMPF